MNRPHRLVAAMIPLLCVFLAACGGGGANSSSAASDTGAAAGSAAESTGTGTSASSRYAISGTIFGITGIDVTLSGSAATAAPADSTGKFSFPGLGAGSYTAAPTQPGYVFTPVSRAALLSSESATGLTFTGTASVAPTYHISGIVSGSAAGGVVVTLNGSNVGSTVTDLAGNYSFSGLVSGTYTLSAALPGYAFSAPVIVSVGDEDLGAVNISSRPAGTGTLTFTAGALPRATVGSPYTSTVVQSISGGVAPYRYSSGALDTGTPPLGMIVNPNGNLTGTPDTPGQYEFAVCATDAEGNVSACEPESITVGAAAAPGAASPPKVTLTASSSTIAAGAGLVIDWASQNATSCAAGGGWSGTLTFSGEMTVAPTSSTAYSVTCTNAQGSAQATGLVTVQGVGGGAAAPTVNLWATNANISAGGTSTLQWSSTGATSCTSSGGWAGGQAIGGARAVNPAETTLYVLTCTGAGGTAQAQAVVAVDTTGTQAPTVSLTASQNDIASGGSAVLSWSATNAGSCTSSGGWTGTDSISGSQTVSPAVTTLYVLTCTGAGGSAQSQTVIAVDTTGTQAPTVSLTASQNDIASGGSAVLTWSATNASSCTASGGWSGTESISGSQTVSPAVTTLYVLTCTGAGGSAPAQAVIGVGSSGVPPGTSWVYYDGDFDWPGDYSYVAVPDYQDTSGNPLSGPYDIKITLTAAYGGWLPYAQNWDFNSQGYTKLTFALKPTVPNQQWTVYFVKVGDVPVGIYLNVLDYGPAPVVGQWNTYTVPLADLGVLGQSIYKFCIQDKTGLANNVWYADNVGFAP
jgi:hypothetical protein